jgi:hypothetical protein
LGASAGPAVTKGCERQGGLERGLKQRLQVKYGIVMSLQLHIKTTIALRKVLLA